MVKPCPCGSTYTVESPGQDYCGSECRSRFAIKRHRDGYIMRYVPDHPRASDGYVLEHVLIAEKVLGHYLPASVVVHHFDGDGQHNSNANLVICEDQAYHMLLHRRQRCLNAGGNPNTDKICCTCQKPKPTTEFTRNVSTWDGFHPDCKRCKCNRESLRKRTRRAEKKQAAMIA